MATFRGALALAVAAWASAVVLWALRRARGGVPQPVDSDHDEAWLRVVTRARSLCSRASAVSGQCAAIIVRDGRVLAWGYARSLLCSRRTGRKATDATDIHAEGDAICTAAKNGIALEGSTLYCTVICCSNCYGLVVAAGIKRIVTPGPPNEAFTMTTHYHRRKEIATTHSVAVRTDAVLPLHEPVADGSFLPAIPRVLAPGDDGRREHSRSDGVGYGQACLGGKQHVHRSPAH